MAFVGIVLLPHPDQVRAEKPWHDHVAGCSDCQQAPGHRESCGKAQSLHEEAVEAAHVAHEVAIRQGHEVRLELPQARPQAVWPRLLTLPEARTATAPLPGVDISKYQGSPNFDQLKASGVLYVIPKASEGVGYVDPFFARNWAELHRVGLVPGSYHFSRPDLGNTAAAEADFFLSVIGDPTGSLACHDAESAGGSEGWCAAWKDQFAARTHVIPGFYSFLSWVTSRGIGAGSSLDQSWLWLAWPDSNGSLPIPAPWKRVAIQQYSADPVPGISGLCDVNRFFGSLAELAALAGQAAPKQRNRQMRVIQDGHGTDYITNGVQLRGIAHPVELADLLRICGQTEPEVISQYTKDRIEEVYPIPANESRPVLDPWSLAADAHTGASYAAPLGQIQASVNELGKAIHNGAPGTPATPVDIEALAAAIVAKLPVANDPRAVASAVLSVLPAAVATVLGERLVLAPSPSPAPAHDPAPTPTGGT